MRKREGGNVDGGNNDILEDVMAPKCSDVCKFLLTLDEKRRRNCRRCRRQRGHCRRHFICLRYCRRRFSSLLHL